MPKLTATYIASRWPRLFHMAEKDSWPSIRRYGLRSTSALLDLFEITEPRRSQIESARRPEMVKLEHSAYGTVWIRDNKPISEAALRRTLDGMSLSDWYRTLNSRVFFWLDESRLDRLRNARAYKHRQHDILVLDTERLLGTYGDSIELSPLNSGAVHGAAQYRRGVGTFAKISDYPWSARLDMAPRQPIVELTLPYMLENVDAFVLDVSTR